MTPDTQAPLFVASPPPHAVRKAPPRQTVPDDLTLKPGSPRCQCPACGRFFLGPSLFDLHIKVDKKTGDVSCRDPATIRTKAGKPVMEQRNGWWLTCRS